MFPVRIETPRLVLREFDPGDVAGVLTWVSDENVLRFTRCFPQSESDVQRGLALLRAQRREMPRVRYEFAVTLADTEELVGWVPFLLEADLRSAEIGWMFAQAFWGRGYATEAVCAVWQWATQTLRLNHAWARCDARNRASLVVARKVGMVPASLPRLEWVKNEWAEYVYFEWERRSTND